MPIYPDQHAQNAQNSQSTADGETLYQMPQFVTPFREKHLIEDLSVRAADPMHQVLFYSMLNQANKRGK